MLHGEEGKDREQKVLGDRKEKGGRAEDDKALSPQRYVLPWFLNLPNLQNELPTSFLKKDGLHYGFARASVQSKRPVQIST